MKAEHITYTTTVEIPIADADGRPIREGSILRHVEDGFTGVVTCIGREGSRAPLFIPMFVGDLVVQKDAGTTRISNAYSKWRHVQHNEQTYDQRFVSWLHTKGSEDYLSERLSKDAQMAITGIMALLPHGWEDGDWPGSIEEALGMLAKHLSETQ